MKIRSSREWCRLTALAGFFALSFAISFDWTPALAQEKAAKKAENKKARQAATDSTASNRPTPGTGQKLDAAALAKIIDAEINRQLAAEKIPASARSDDAEFYRRLNLDLVGCIPSAEKTTAFLDSKDPNKRAKAIDELLADERFGKFHAEIWSGMMLPRESNNRRLNGAPLEAWMSDEFNKNVPLNTMVYDLLTATGEQDKNGATTYFIANPSVDKITDNVTRLFLGVQLQCAQCHNHPFTDWKQKEYWGMAQFFSKVRVNGNPNKAAKDGTPIAIIESDKQGKKKGLPESALKVSAKFLGGAEPKLVPTEPNRPVLAKWLVAAENPYFARAMVNRVWHSLFGRGIVNPVDDMREANEPTHPELLDALTEQFKSSGFDMKYVMRAILNSEAYQRTSHPLVANKDDRELYSHRSVRSMLPEQLFDSLAMVIGREDRPRKGEMAPPMGKGKKGAGARDQFLNFFRVVEEPDVMQYEVGIPQVLRLMNSGQTNSVQGIADRAMKTAGADNAKTIEQIYLTALSRRPTADETKRIVELVQKTPASSRTVYGDLYWAMLNSSEFVLNH
jgi:Protein of unknown function (DUF1553)/Protein of unknown function (DUF1549)